MCPNCQKPCECFAREGTDSFLYWDEYTRYCPKCGYISKEKVDKRSCILGIIETKCPFCGERAKDHQRTPRELIQGPAT